MSSIPLPEPGKHRDLSSTCTCGTVPNKALLAKAAYAQTWPLLLRIGEVEEFTGLSRSTIYRYLEDEKEKQDFPRPVNVGAWAVRWVLSEILRWVADRQRERDASSDS